RLRAYPCGASWHLTSIPGRPQVIDPPVTVVRFDPCVGKGSDKRRRGERDYRAGRRERLQVMLGRIDDSEIQAHQESVKGLHGCCRISNIAESGFCTAWRSWTIPPRWSSAT
ncbi:hypothetical protein ACFQ07_22525, partial [Actinomadura adrarensis]